MFRAGESKCHRHSPVPLDEPSQLVHWPVVSPDARCGAGADVAQPGEMALVGCVDCVFWMRPDDGLVVKHRQGKSLEWWSGAGLCTANAPSPGTSKTGTTHWRPTHKTDACGNGVHFESASDDTD